MESLLKTSWYGSFNPLDDPSSRRIIESSMSGSGAQAGSKNIDNVDIGDSTAPESSHRSGRADGGKGKGKGKGKNDNRNSTGGGGGKRKRSETDGDITMESVYNGSPAVSTGRNPYMRKSRT